MSNSTQLNATNQRMVPKENRSNSSIKKKQLNLRGNVADFLFFHYFKYATEGGSLTQRLEWPINYNMNINELMRLLLVSQKYCNAYFEKASYSLVIATDFARLSVAYEGFEINLFEGVTLDFPANVICLCRVHSIHIRAYSQEPGRQMFKSYGRFCKQIKDANVVRDISLYIDTAWSIENRSFLDLLPDAITSLSGSSDGARLMGKRRKVLDNIKLKVSDRYDPIKDEFVSIYYKPILESRVRHIQFKSDPYAQSYIYGLDGMDDMYPMKPNPYLESVQIFARMFSSKYEVECANEDYNNMKEDRVWLDGRFEKYKKAFRALSSLNSKFELYVKDDQTHLVHLFTIDKVIEKLRLYFKNIELFCQAAVDAQVNLVNVQLKPEVCLPTYGYLTKKWQEACIKKIHDEYGIEFLEGHNDYFIMTGTITMSGVEVEVNLFFIKGNSNEIADDPYDGEWRLPEYRTHEVSISNVFYNYLNDNSIMDSAGDEE